MRLLFAVQRYGAGATGGAEAACRQFATRLAARGHEVEVVTSCATDYLTWADAMPPGVAVEDGVTVHRLPVAAPRDLARFGPLDQRAVDGHRPTAGVVEEAWMLAQGPRLAGYRLWLDRRLGGVDALVCWTYLYATTWEALGAASGVVPTVLHAAAHDEPQLAAGIFDRVLAAPAAHAWFTPEERELVERRLGSGPRRGAVVGIGADLGVGGDAARFRARIGTDRPYVLYVGRIDTAKGVDRLHRRFTAARPGGDPAGPALVLVGDGPLELPEHPDVVRVGRVDDATRADAIAGCAGLLQPSRYESFSLVLTEAWAGGRPVVVEAGSPVLAGQVGRSGGGVAVSGAAAWAAAIDELVADRHLGDRLGAAGRRYLEAHLTWGAVLDRYEELLDRAVSSGPWPS